jgi:hypothetical protein
MSKIHFLKIEHTALYSNAHLAILTIFNDLVAKLMTLKRSWIQDFIRYRWLYENWTLIFFIKKINIDNRNTFLLFFPLTKDKISVMFFSKTHGDQVAIKKHVIITFL